MQYEETTLAIIKDKIVKTDKVLRILAQKRSENVKLAAKYQTLLSKHSEKCREAANVVKEKCIIEEELKRYMNTSVTLEFECKELKQQCKVLEDTHNSYVNKSELKYQTANQELQLCNKKCEFLSSQVTNLERKLEDSSFKLKTQESSRECKITEQHKSKLAELTKKNKELEAVISTLTEDNKGNLERLANLQLEFNKLKDVEEANAVHDFKNTNIQKTVEELQLQLKIATEELEQLKITNESEQRNLNDTHNAKLNSFDEAYVALKQNQEKLKNELETIEIENKKLNDALVEVQIERNLLKNELDDILVKREQDKRTLVDRGIQTAEEVDEMETIDYIFSEMQSIPKALTPLSMLSNEDSYDFHKTTETESVAEIWAEIPINSTPTQLDVSSVPKITVTPPTPPVQLNDTGQIYTGSDIITTFSGDFVVAPSTGNIRISKTNDARKLRAISRGKHKKQRHTDKIKIGKLLKVINKLKQGVRANNEKLSQLQSMTCGPPRFMWPSYMYGHMCECREHLSNMNYNPSCSHGSSFCPIFACRAFPDQVLKTEEPFVTRSKSCNVTPAFKPEYCRAHSRETQESVSHKRNDFKPSKHDPSEYDSLASSTEPEIADLFQDRSTKRKTYKRMTLRSHLKNNEPSLSKSKRLERRVIEVSTSDSEGETIDRRNRKERVSSRRNGHEKQVDSDSEDGFKGFAALTDRHSSECGVCAIKQKLRSSFVKKQREKCEAFNESMKSCTIDDKLHPVVNETSVFHSHNSLLFSSSCLTPKRPGSCPSTFANVNKNKNIHARSVEHCKVCDTVGLDITQKNLYKNCENHGNFQSSSNAVVGNRENEDLLENIYETEQRSIDSGYMRSGSDLDLFSDGGSDEDVQENVLEVSSKSSQNKSIIKLRKTYRKCNKNQQRPPKRNVKKLSLTNRILLKPIEGIKPIKAGSNSRTKIRPSIVLEKMNDSLVLRAEKIPIESETNNTALNLSDQRDEIIESDTFTYTADDDKFSDLKNYDQKSKLYLFGSDSESNCDDKEIIIENDASTSKGSGNICSNTKYVGNVKRKVSFSINNRNKKIKTNTADSGDTPVIENHCMESENLVFNKKRIAHKTVENETNEIDCKNFVNNLLTSQIDCVIANGSKRLSMDQHSSTEVNTSPRRLSPRLQMKKTLQNKALFGESTRADQNVVKKALLPNLETVKKSDDIQNLMEKRREAIEKLRGSIVKQIEPSKTSFKRPKITKLVPDGPLSPEPEKAPRKLPAPKIIPLERPPKLTQKAAKALFGKLISFPMATDVLQEVADVFATQETQHVAKLVLHEVCTDIHCKADAKYPLAPFMTDTQRLLLVLMLKLETMNVDNVCGFFMGLAEKYLLKTKDLKPALAVGRLYVATCKCKKKINRIRRMCFDALYFMGDLVVPFLHMVLTNWLEVLPRKSDPIDAPLMKVLVHVIYLKDCKTADYSLDAVSLLLIKHYKYERGLWTSEQLLTEFVKEYLVKRSKSSEYAVLILCKNIASKLAFKIIETHLKPAVLKTNDTAFAAAVIVLIGKIASHFDVETDASRVKIVEEFLKELATDSALDVIKNSIIASLNKLPKSKTSIARKNIWCSL